MKTLAQKHSLDSCKISHISRHVGMLLLFVVSLSACSKWSDETNRALKLAGENRAELEKVLQHYSEVDPNSQKLKAAEFLISNMDVHYGYKSASWDQFQQELADLFSREDNFELLEEGMSRLYEKYQMLLRDIRYESDLRTVTADFLIYNIEKAFESWSGPYANQLSFDEFCEYLLPYRAANEPISDWRREFEENYIPELYDRAAVRKDSLSAEDLCNLIKSYPYGNLSIVGGRLPDYNSYLLSILRMGSCKHYCSQAILASRCLGVPVALDYTPQWATRSLGHEWNVLICDSKRPLSFGIGDDCALGEHVERIPDRKAPKVYRQTFSKQKESLMMLRGNEEIPGSLSSPCMKDVTDLYYDCTSITVDFDFRPPGKNKFAYLAVFDNKEWIPVAWARVKGGRATFSKINKEIMYLPGYFSEGRFIPAADPIMVDSLGNSIPVRFDAVNKQTVVLYRKYQNALVEGKCEDMTGGRFQVANKPDFSDAVDIAVIDELPESCYHIIKPETEGSYKYFRYLARSGALGTIAELEVYELDKKLSGKIIGTEQDIPYFTKEKAFDGDPLTSFNKWGMDEVWLGLEFDSPKKITKLVYLPGNDDNCIRDGELYELFYWDKTWKSLGQQYGSAETYRLSYENVPSGALFLLRNHTKGVEERIFTYENNKQVWW
ncbi:discoidin domain-containing protein [Xiashengella succiniciproducens]|uniref:Discoidin domain-containing protein n=1 Tax=Xiashengella succiniciproducens TaxID=2949635 RepID=A0A9J6ZS01_9BACT|nr:discoidin domain-containing protein [Alkaliflexus sp. Ai-910]URW80382.1 discoidin domain-containing protein [Alkaliflexus sp. Ai-910]